MLLMMLLQRVLWMCPVSCYHRLLAIVAVATRKGKIASGNSHLSFILRRTRSDLSHVFGSGKVDAFEGGHIAVFFLGSNGHHPGIIAVAPSRKAKGMLREIRVFGMVDEG